MGIMLLFQLLSVPIFLKFWGVNLYGEWLTLNTLTAYFQMTDIGLNTATGNSFTFHYVKSEFDKCSILINNNIFFIFLAFGIIFILMLVLIELNFFTSLFQFKLISNITVNICLILLLGQVFIGTLNNLLNTFYIAVGNYARGVMIDNVIRISEYLVLLIGVIADIPIYLILLFGLLTKVIGVLIKYLDSTKYYKLELSYKYLKFKELKEIVIPALSFFSFPVANSMIFQGVTLLVNFFLGSIAVVVFNTTRTFVNFCRSVIDILHKSVWPEYTLAYGHSNIKTLRQLHRKTVLLSIILIIITSIFLLMFGKTIYLVWTKGSTEFDPTLFYCFIAALLTNTIWSSSNVLLQSTNNHKVFSLLYLICAIIALFTAFVVLKFTDCISYLPLSFVFIDILLIFYVIRTSLVITGDSLKEFTNSFSYKFY